MKLMKKLQLSRTVRTFTDNWLEYKQTTSKRCGISQMFEGQQRIISALEIGDDKIPSDPTA